MGYGGRTFRARDHGFQRCHRLLRRAVAAGGRARRIRSRLGLWLCLGILRWRLAVRDQCTHDPAPRLVRPEFDGVGRAVFVCDGRGVVVGVFHSAGPRRAGIARHAARGPQRLARAVQHLARDRPATFTMDVPAGVLALHRRREHGDQDGGRLWRCTRLAYLRSDGSTVAHAIRRLPRSVGVWLHRQSRRRTSGNIGWASGLHRPDDRGDQAQQHRGLLRARRGGRPGAGWCAKPVALAVWTVRAAG